MKLYGLIGFPLGHSFSAKYFAEKFAAENITDCEYRNFPIEDITAVNGLVGDNPELEGFNVTIPYKQAVIPYLGHVDREAEAIGAVNCVKILREEGRTELAGYNTDAYGFRTSLLDLIGRERPAALVLGTGGSSKAVIYVLESLGMNHTGVSRSPDHGDIGYGDLTEEIIRKHRLIVNCTPLGTFPLTEGFPQLPYEYIGPSHFLFDLVYNPPLTEFLRKGAANGAKTKNGYEMLISQAERSWQIWHSSF